MANKTASANQIFPFVMHTPFAPEWFCQRAPGGKVLIVGCVQTNRKLFTDNLAGYFGPRGRVYRRRGVYWGSEFERLGSAQLQAGPLLLEARALQDRGVD